MYNWKFTDFWLYLLQREVYKFKKKKKKTPVDMALAVHDNAEEFYIICEKLRKMENDT